jgi:hypothetical protein
LAVDLLERAMRHGQFLCGVLLLALGNCSNVSGPKSTKTAYGNLLRSWMLVAEDTAGCAGPRSSTQTIVFDISQTSEDVYTIGGRPYELTLQNGTSTWSAGSAAGYMTGYFLLDLPGAALLNFVTGPVDPGIAHNVLQFTGTLDANLHLLGVLDDPVQGAPVLSASACRFRASGGPY